MAQETFGQRLSKLRKEKGITQNEIADKVGVTSQAVSKWENDQASPDIDVLIKLGDIFDISLDELLGREKTYTTLGNKPSKKDFDKMVFRIAIKSSDGDVVNLNLPLRLVKIINKKDNGNSTFLSGNNDALKDVDFKQLIEMVEEGAIGELITIDASNGDKISIIVE